ncbi:MAG: histidine phosphatase family protein [Oscillospiraceae bacterium]|jgi:alpha-ribazole phosphatase|nr:histidine phosphatase family protein [Oscillospiraceae bacterium]
MDLILLRHAATAGNLERRYIGATDEPLSDEGIAAARLVKLPIQPQRVYASPTRRCAQTSLAIFPCVPITIEPDLREASFGAFENHTYDELKDNPDYQRWLDSGGAIAPPGGETIGEVRARVLGAWERVREDCRAYDRAALVVHGGTIMTLTQARLGGGLFDWQVPNCGGYIVRIIDGAWSLTHRL